MYSFYASVYIFILAILWPFDISDMQHIQLTAHIGLAIITSVVGYVVLSVFQET